MVITSVSSVGDTNKYAILKKIRERDGISREQLAHELKLSPPAVSKNVSSLLNAKIIYEHGTAGTSIGRKPINLYYNYNIMYVIGVELMPQAIRGALADFQGNILADCSAPSDVRISSRKTLENLEYVIDGLINEAPSRDKVRCICIASPGSGKNATRFNLLSEYQAEWEGMDIQEQLRQRYDADIIVMNDVELDLIGEHWKGAGKGRENIVLLKCGDGFASRAMIDGRIFSGANHMAGDIGLYVRDYANGREKFSLPGALEQKLCNALTQSYQDAGGTTENGERLTLKWMIRNTAKGDPAAKIVLQLILEDIAVVLTNTILVMDPELVILGGAAAYFTEENVSFLRTFIHANTPYPPEILTSKLLERSGIYGAIRTAINHAETFLAELWK